MFVWKTREVSVSLSWSHHEFDKCWVFSSLCWKGFPRPRSLLCCVYKFREGFQYYRRCQNLGIVLLDIWWLLIVQCSYLIVADYLLLILLCWLFGCTATHLIVIGCQFKILDWLQLALCIEREGGRFLTQDARCVCGYFQFCYIF